MWHWGWGLGHVFFPFFLIGAGFKLVVVGAIVVGIIFLVKGVSGRGPSGHSEESARDILEKRFARGEITREQFEEMKRTLG